MPFDVTLAIVTVFVAVALTTGLAMSYLLSLPQRRRLRSLAPGREAVVAPVARLQASEVANPALARLSKALPTSPREQANLKLQLGMAGHHSPGAIVVYSVSKLAVPAVAAMAALLWLGVAEGWLLAVVAAVVGYFVPELVLSRLIQRRQKLIRNALPDALDMFVVCIEAGSSLDQAIVKASEELEIAHPVLTQELRMVTTEIRAGRPRLQAFQNLADRTRVDEVRTLVSMLTQTDRFGTSIAQGLRTHADSARTKRRQRAEERAAKVGVKLVFPLVLCLFPSIYVVCLGPVAVRIFRTLW